MKFASIYLQNYIGIYNGMGLYEIHIDMTKCVNRITIIRGDNGSGKSTLSKALNLFPDPNDAFIPNLPARKEIVLVDQDTLYKLVFIHGIKQNGERETTKAYITKTFNGVAVELNENGNVSSYKDILYSELGLDANFAALSQLSNEDRGLADKKPAERKRFVNSIISSLDTYNSIYKTLSKRSSNYKSMINAIIAKLNILGDEESLMSSLNSLESRINNLQDLKDRAVADLAKEQSTISILDPDGSIQNRNMAITAELELANNDRRKIQSIIDSLITSNSISIDDINSEYKKIINLKNSLIIQNQIDRNSVDSLMSQKESEAEELNRKIQRLNTLQSGYNYESLKCQKESYERELQQTRDMFNEIGIADINSINREEYIMALKALKDLEEYISSFKSSADFSLIEEIVSEYMKTGIVPSRIDITPYETRSKDVDRLISKLSEKRAVLESRMSLLEKLKLRPKTCKDDCCGFIKEAVEFSKQDPEKESYDLYVQIELLKDEKASITVNIETTNNFNDTVNRFATIVREIDRNSIVLSKMPNGDMFSNKMVFFERLLSGYSFEYMKSIYQYIDLANMIDVYKNTTSLYDEVVNELKIYESKAEAIDSLLAEIDSINKAIDEIADKIIPINKSIFEREEKISELQELEAAYDAIFSQIEKQKPILEKIKECEKQLSENSKKMQDINLALNRAEVAKEAISQYNFALAPLMKDRDKALHSVQLMQDYMKEKEELQRNYDFIETIKYYSSPTTGIQLVFMDLYMGKIIELANELLRLLFKGQFEIQPFVINESEFRIPCLGSGYLNDDISSMSSSQIGMISMILSFALLHHSSTKYNIIKLDEIDGPLDYNNRVYFVDVLNSIMDIMGTEQCIMISHNSELQIDNSDVILLRHDDNNMDYNRGNIIWRYQ